MNFEEWKEQERKKRGIDKPNPFFGRENELAELKAFLADETARVYGLYGVPMIGKTSLVREFLKSVANYEIQTVEFKNPENPEITLDKALSTEQTVIDWQTTAPKLIIIENFEEALQWKGDQDHLHEIKFEKIKQFLEVTVQVPFVKLILESRFQIKMDFLPGKIYTHLTLGGIDRTELFNRLNQLYRNNEVTYEAFEELCEKFNDHVWLIELAMQNEWMFQDVQEAVQHRQIITQKLWETLKGIIRKLTTPQKTLLCAFALLNPISETDLEKQLKTLPMFQKPGELEDGLQSLRKKLLTVYNAQDKTYEINPFLRDVCFTFLQNQKEMRTLETLSYFNKAQKPQYDRILQAQEKGDYGTFYRLIRDLRKKGDYEKVHKILDYVFENDSVINRVGVLNEKGIAYKEQKNYDEAIRILKQAAESGNIHSYNELALIYKELRNYDEAILIFKELIDKHNYIPAYIELAIIYKEQKNYDEAIRLLKRAAELGNIHSYNELAIVYEEQKNYDEAIRSLNKPLKTNDKDVKTLNELAIVYEEQKSYDEVINILNKALEVNEKIVKVLNESAIAYKELGDFVKALHTRQRDLKSVPDDKVFRLTLSSIEQVIDNPNKREEMKSSKRTILFVAANPSNETRIQTDREHRIIKAEIGRGPYRDAFEFLLPQFAVTITELLRAMNAKPNIVHFSGHGDTDGIVITTEDNRSQILPILALQRLFRPLKDITEIVILNSCYSAEQARLISEFGMYVVGNNLSIGDDAAISFAKGLYNGLSEGKSFEDAFNDALIVVITESPNYSSVIEVWKDGNKLDI
jgi:tetratricopeptide (TPR) repeat protein